jgi:hypothetical protein
MLLVGDTKSGAHGMKGKCVVSRAEIIPTGIYSNALDPGVWKQWADCPTGTAICGYQSKVEDQQGNQIGIGKDDSAMNDIRIACCRLCSLVDAQYTDGNTCKYCHHSCKTCSGGASNQCQSCYFTIKHPHTLSVYNECVAPSCKYTIMLH